MNEETTTTGPDKRLSLPHDQPMVPGLVDAFRSVLAYAVTMAAGVDNDPVTAVHEYRKSVRRARSVLRMLRPALGKAERQALQGALRAIADPTSILRDTDVLVDTCDSLELGGSAADTLRRVHEQLVAHSDELRSQNRAAKVLGDGARRLSSLADALDAAVRPETPPRELIDAFQRTFRRAERARRRAIAKANDSATHDWRKRVKEVRYQLEMLSEPDPGPVDGLRRVYAALARRLGAITDVIALRRFVREHARDLGETEAVALDTALAAHIDAQRRVASDDLVDVRERIRELAVSPE